MIQYEDDYFEEDMVNSAEMAAHQPQDSDTVEYVTSHDPVNHPRHYGGFSNGAEVIDLTENLTFNAGNATKYLCRAGRIDGRNKGDVIEDLRKAAWYVARELKRLGDSDA